MKATLAPGSVGTMCQWRCLVGWSVPAPQRRMSWTGFFVSNFEAVSVLVLVKYISIRTAGSDNAHFKN